MKKDERPVMRDRDEPMNRMPTEAEMDAAREEALPSSAEDIAALLREDAMNNALPTPPQLPGWHLCWLSTTNTYTPIQSYTRLGYVPVKQHEMPEWQWLKQHSAAQPDGDIAANEMVLYKVREDVYQQIMRVMHHDRPNAEGERLRNNIEELKETHRDSEGTSLVHEEGDGFAAVTKRVTRVGRFE